MKRTFEDFLQEIFMRDNPMILDDNLPDAFDDWMGNLEVDECLRLAELYGKEQYTAGIESSTLPTTNTK